MSLDVHIAPDPEDEEEVQEWIEDDEEAYAQQVATGACIRSIGFYLQNTQLGDTALKEVNEWQMK